MQIKLKLLFVYIIIKSLAQFIMNVNVFKVNFATLLSSIRLIIFLSLLELCLIKPFYMFDVTNVTF